MKKRFPSSIRKFLSRTAPIVNTINQPSDMDVREEYAHAFRTESYNEFWTRVLTLSNKDLSKCVSIESSTTADRLSSYRLFSEQLLDPDQPTVIRILSLVKTHWLLFDYFSETANASFLFSRLLKETDHVRANYRSFKNLINSLEDNHCSSLNQFPSVIARLTELSNSSNPFAPSALSPSRLQLIQAGCSKLLNQLESTRNKTRTKLRILNISEHGSAIFLVVVTASLTVILASHAFALLVATPGLIAASLTSTKRLVKLSTQLDIAAKGTYILNRDLDTISRLVARLNDELEHMRSMVKFWLERGEARLQASCEVVRQMMKNDSRFIQQLDELEEHLYLCFMTVNRARNLVVKQVLDPGQSTIRELNMMSK